VVTLHGFRRGFDVAWWRECADVVEYLVSAGCDVNAQSNSGRTALWKAAQSGRREIVHLLYALGASVDRRSQVTRQCSMT